MAEIYGALIDIAAEHRIVVRTDGEPSAPQDGQPPESVLNSLVWLRTRLNPTMIEKHLWHVAEHSPHPDASPGFYEDLDDYLTRLLRHLRKLERQERREWERKQKRDAENRARLQAAATAARASLSQEQRARIREWRADLGFNDDAPLLKGHPCHALGFGGLAAIRPAPETYCGHLRYVGPQVDLSEYEEALARDMPIPHAGRTQF